MNSDELSIWASPASKPASKTSTKKLSRPPLGPPPIFMSPVSPTSLVGSGEVSTVTIKQTLNPRDAHRDLFSRMGAIVAKKSTYDVLYPNGWYINKDGLVIAGLPVGFTQPQIVSLWKQFPGGWYIGNRYTIGTFLGNIHTYVRGKVEDILSPDMPLSDEEIGIELGELLIQVGHSLSLVKKRNSFNPDKPNRFLEALENVQNALLPSQRGGKQRIFRKEPHAVENLIDSFPKGHIALRLRHLVFPKCSPPPETHPIDIKDHTNLLLHLLHIHALLDKKISSEQ